MSRRVRAVFGAMAVAGVLAALPTAAHADPPRGRPELLAALTGFEREPDLAEVQTWGADGAVALMDLGNDGGAVLATRVRAVYALRAFPQSPAVQTYLRALVAVPGQPLLLLRAGLDALVVGFHDVAPVVRFLRDPDVLVRDGAAWALAQAHTPAAHDALAAALRSERDATVRATLQSALQH